MSASGRMDWDSWAYSLVAGFISGGSGAVVSGITVSMLDPKDFNFLTHQFYILVSAVFLANGVLSAMAYLHQNPLPPVTTVTTVETTQQLPTKPPATVVTTVEKTEVGPPSEKGKS